jgi:predicted dinucleotide-binding enzyme
MDFQTVGTIGAGAVVQAVGAHLLSAGHMLLISNSRGPETLDDVAATVGAGAEAALTQLGGPLSGKHFLFQG